MLDAHFGGGGIPSAPYAAVVLSVTTLASSWTSCSTEPLSPYITALRAARAWLIALECCIGTLVICASGPCATLASTDCYGARCSTPSGKAVSPISIRRACTAGSVSAFNPLSSSLKEANYSGSMVCTRSPRGRTTAVPSATLKETSSEMSSALVTVSVAAALNTG